MGVIGVIGGGTGTFRVMAMCALVAQVGILYIYLLFFKSYLPLISQKIYSYLAIVAKVGLPLMVGGGMMGGLFCEDCGLLMAIISGLLVSISSSVFLVLLANVLYVVFLMTWSCIKKKSSEVSCTEEVPSVSSAPSAAQIPITRSAFLLRSTLLLGAMPYFAISYSVLRGAYTYQVHKHVVHLPRLPRTFDGLRIGQVSDLHVGSFFNKSLIQPGIDLLSAEKPDIIFFTGDMINTHTTEMRAYMSLFSQWKAPLGIFSVLGNHDYGFSLANKISEAENMRKMTALHKALNWRLLRNESYKIKVDNVPLSIVGVENWGVHTFKRGHLDRALEDVDSDCCILLSHDPSHWSAEVLNIAPKVALTCSGHTHGFQMGIETPAFRWSPGQYLYKHWAGLYKEGDQYLNVNRGFGFLGFSGRMGIWPEISILELRSSPG